MPWCKRDSFQARDFYRSFLHATLSSKLHDCYPEDRFLVDAVLILKRYELKEYEWNSRDGIFHTHHMKKEYY